MYGYTKELEVYGCALVAYKSIMNTNEHRNKIIKSLIKRKNISFIGSYMVFDPSNEAKLEDHYVEDGENTTEGQRASAIKKILIRKIRGAKTKYMCLTLGSIMYTNNVSHHVGFFLYKSGRTVYVKVLNSGIYYLSRSYGDLASSVLSEAISESGMSQIFCESYIGTQWMGMTLQQKCNPQDYCRGGLFGELKTFVDYRANIHRESYCQTWCIMMLAQEAEQDNYDFNTNYMSSWPTDKKQLEIGLRRFILKIVKQFEGTIDFLYEFRRELDHSSLTYPNVKFSTVLRRCFQNLHNTV
jgi:hypothetical protein